MSENPSKELSVPDAPSNGGLLERFDLADDKKIIEAMAKRVTAGFTYKVNGKHGLSSAGALWAAREFAKQGEVYRVQGEPKIEICPLDPECINVWVKVQRFFVNPATGQEIALDSTFGHKRMSRKTKRYKDDSGTDFDMVEDPEFTTKAITKAERNGKLKLMPKDAVTNMIAKATGQVTTPPPPKGNTAPPKGNTAPPKDTAKPVTPPAGASGGTPSTPPKEEAKKPEEPKKTEEVKKPEEAKKVEEPKKTEEPKKAAAPPAPPADSKPKMSKEVMVQKLDAVCKMVFNTQDGAEAWSYDGKKLGYSSPLYHVGKVFCAIGDEGKTFAWDAKSGKQLWETKVTQVIYDSSFTHSNGHLYIGSVNGTLNCLDEQTGKLQYQYRLGPGHVFATPTADDQRVYIGSLSGQVTAFPTR